jgi:hypothetical protein
MLEEAVEVIRMLWQGGDQSHDGRHYTVENARVYDLPAAPPRILVSGFGPKAIRLAARIGDGFCTTSPDKDAIELYRSEGGKGPIQAGTKVCFMDDERQAMETVLRLWPNEGLPGELAQVLPTPAHFEQACELVTAEQIASPVGPDLDRHVESLQQYADAGVDELFVQQIGPEQDAFFTTWAREVSRASGERAAGASSRSDHAGSLGAIARVAPITWSPAKPLAYRRMLYRRRAASRRCARSTVAVGTPRSSGNRTVSASLSVTATGLACSTSRDSSTWRPRCSCVRAWTPRAKRGSWST